MAATPKDAATVILLRDPADPKFFWVKRNPNLVFMGGFHTFPGGQLDPEDLAVTVLDCEPGDESAMRVCAVRELFEETGVLLANGFEMVRVDELKRARRLLDHGEISFKRFFDDSRLELIGSDLINAGRWVTPPFAPKRFDTWFFVAWLPEGQEASIEPGELESGEWVRPAEAVARWQRGEVIMAPPTLHAVRTLAVNCRQIDRAPAIMRSAPEANRGAVRRIEFGPGIFYFPVRTPTLPPATHTNCYVVGGDELLVIDPASPYEEEQGALDGFLDHLITEGRRIREIILTHHHTDHVSGVNHLSKRLHLPVAAHQITADRLHGSVRIDRFIEDNELIELEGDPGWRLRALHTPGHTRGHLCFHEEQTGALITGDLVVGLGTVVIDPPEGNMLEYFNSLKRLLKLPKLGLLFGAHGPPIYSAAMKIKEYIDHRTMREDKILDAIRAGAVDTREIVPLAYTDVSPALYGLAERSTLAHIEKLEEEGRVIRIDGMYTAV